AASAATPGSPSERERRRRLENPHRKWNPSARPLEQRAAGAARALVWGAPKPRGCRSAARAAREHASHKNERRPSARALELADGVWGARREPRGGWSAGRAAPEHWTGPQLRMTEGLHLVVVTGLSGSGKSTAIKVLEDLGFYCIDNLPVA